MPGKQPEAAGGGCGALSARCDASEWGENSKGAKGAFSRARGHNQGAGQELSTSLGRSQPWAVRDLGGGRSLAPACRQGGLKGGCSDNLDHWIMDEWHISVKENWETKLIVLVAAPWGTRRLGCSPSWPLLYVSGRRAPSIYSLNFPSVLSSHPPLAPSRKCSHSLQHTQNPGLTEGFYGEGSC